MLWSNNYTIFTNKVLLNFLYIFYFCLYLSQFLKKCSNPSLENFTEVVDAKETFPLSKKSKKVS